MNVINPFNDIENKPFRMPGNEIYGKDYLSSLSALEIGRGAEGFRADQSGIWLGAQRFADAPFKVDMNGNVTATLAAIIGAISGGTIDIGGADATSFHVDANGNLWLGNALFASAPFKVSNAGAMTAQSVTIKDSGGTSFIDSSGLVGTNNFTTAQAGSTNSSTTTTTSTSLVDIPNCTNASFQISRSRMMLAILTCELLFQSADTGVEAYIHISGDVNDVQEPRISLVGSKYNATGTGDFITLTTYVFRLITAASPPTTYVIKGQWKAGAGTTATIRNRQLSYYLLGS